MRLLGLTLFLAISAIAQVSDGVTTTVSRSANVTPDEADFSVTVDTTLDVTQDQVMQVFRDAGIQNLNVVSVGSAPSYLNVIADPSGNAPVAPKLEYQIAFTTAPAAMAAYIRKLDSLNAKLPTGFESVQYNAGLSASQAALTSAFQATLPQLLQDARTKAQALAAAASLRLGAIISIGDGTAPGAPGALGFVGIPVARIVYGLAPAFPYSFSLAVKFAAQ